MRYSVGCLCCLLIIAGCETPKKDLKTCTVNSVYTTARQLLASGEYTKAAAEFKDIETLFPYSTKATEGQVLAAYCFFMADSYLDAIREINVFLRYHPSHELVPYAMYLKAMCMYMQVASVGRDSKMAVDSKYAFMELINKFPNSKYYEDSLKRVMILDDIIAAHEMMIGRYYQTHSNALPAIGRYTFVSSQLAHTNYAQEAIYRIVECCSSIGLKDEAQQAYEALKLDYPNSSWTQKAAQLLKK